MRLLRAAAVSFAALAALVPAAGAAALTQNGVLASAAVAVDYYQVTCSNNGAGAPASLAVQVEESGPIGGPRVALQVMLGATATTTSDPVEGDGVASPLVALAGGAAVFSVFVDKSDAGAAEYVLTAQCMTGANGSGSPTGTALAAISTSAPPVPALPPPAGWLLAAVLAAAGLVAARRVVG